MFPFCPNCCKVHLSGIVKEMILEMKSEHKDIHAITQDRVSGRQVPVSQEGQSQEQPTPVFAKLPPEQQQKLSDEMSATTRY